MNFIKARFDFCNIGQGLFYFGNIYSNKFTFTFVYDCGTESKHMFLNNEIDRVSNILENKCNIIDLLVVSHFDADHIIGLNKLLFKNSVKTILIPYLLPIQRLILAIKYPNEQDEYYEFLSDPVNYLSIRGVNEIIILGNNPPGSEEEFIADFSNDFNKTDGPLVDKLPVDKDLTEKFSSNEEYESEVLNNPKVKIKSHNGYLFIKRIWVFRFYNYSINEELALRFKQCLIDEHIDLNSNEKIKEIISMMKYREPLIKKLQSCYKRIYMDINDTSIIMYHGPLGDPEVTYIFNDYLKSKILLNLSYFLSLINFGINKMPNLYIREYLTGTILFGDINLNTDLNEIIQHFNLSLKKVFIALVPHHCSKKSWNATILNYVNRESFWVFSAGVKNKYKHPDSQVLDSLKERMFFWNNEVNRLSIIGWYLWRNDV